MSIYDLDTPTLLVDADILEGNLSRMAEAVLGGGKRLRPHTKTHKTVELAKMQLASGATGLTVAKLAEAEVYAEAGLDDIFIANQIVGEQKLSRLMELAWWTQVRVGVDSVAVAEPMARAAEQAGLRIGVMMEVDTGLGRAGVRSPQEGVELAEYLTGQSALELLGVFTHEGQVYKAESVAEGARAAEARLLEVVEAIRGVGVPLEVISMGSTPGAPHLAKAPLPTELRPGVYVYNDRSQVNLGVPLEQCALSVLATVTSVRSDGRIVVDAGSKTLASDSPFADKTTGLVLGHPELEMVGFSEEHGHIQAVGATSLKVGDKVRIIPNHACTCVNMHDSLVVFRGEQAEEVWEIVGRGRIQ